jgi:hypothetical protein
MKKDLPNGWEEIRKRAERLVGTAYQVDFDDGGDSYLFCAGPIVRIEFGRKYVHFHLEWWAKTIGVEWVLVRDKALVVRHPMDTTVVNDRSEIHVNGQIEIHRFDGKHRLEKPS